MQKQMEHFVALHRIALIYLSVLFPNANSGKQQYSSTAGSSCSQMPAIALEELKYVGNSTTLDKILLTTRRRVKMPLWSYGEPVIGSNRMHRGEDLQSATTYPSSPLVE